MIALTVVVSVTVLLSSILLFNTEINNAMHDKIDVALNVVEREIESLKANARVAALGVARNPELIKALVDRDRYQILHITNSLQAVTRIDYCIIYDCDGTVVSRTHEPTEYGDNQAHLPHVSGALSGFAEAYVTQGTFIRLGAYATAPIYDNDSLIGIVAMGFRMNTQEFAYQLKELTGCEISIFWQNERVSSTVTNADGTYVLGARAAEAISERVLSGEQFMDRILLYGKDLLAKYSPLLGPDDEVIGKLSVGYYMDSEKKKIWFFVLRGALITLAVLAASVMLARYISNAIEQQLNKAQKQLAEEMINSEKLAYWYESILDATPLPISVTSTDMKWTFVNKAVEDFLGIRRKDLIGKPCSNLGTNICNTTDCGVACAKRGLEQTFFIHEEKSYQVDVATLKGRNGDTLGYIEVVQDITHIHEHEIELFRTHELNKMQLAKLNLVVKATRIGLWDVEIAVDDPVNPASRFIWSDDYRRMMGYSCEEDFPNTFNSIIERILPDDMEKAVAAFTNHLFDKTGSTPFDVEYRAKKKDGSFADFRVTGETTRDADGTPLRVAGALIDITKAKEDERAISAANERLMLMLDTSPLCAQIWDKNLGTIECNEAAVRLYGFKDKKEYIDMFMKVCSPEFQPDGQRSDEKAAKLVNQAFKEGSCVFEWMHEYPKDGTPIPAKITLVRAKYGDDDVVVGYTSDLREHKAHLAEIEKTHENLRQARDAAESANKLKSVFLANMSHEIRTPMNSIIGFSELALDDDVAPRTKEYLNVISESAQWLLNIINDILDSSKIESGNLTLENIPFDLQNVVEQCNLAIMPKAMENEIILHCYCEPFADKRMTGDPVKLRQALLNLLSNAVKFTKSGAVILNAAETSSDENSVTVRFEVKDSGIGMTSEQITRIFEPFIQADDSVTRKFGGTGLGLTITQKIIELMGSALEVKSAIGIGSSFSFEITFERHKETDAAAMMNLAMPQEVEKPRFDHEILICEDNRLNQQLICEHLSRVGIKTVLANNGKEGVDIMAARMKSGEKPFDLILMDVFMPVMSGLEAATEMLNMGVKTPIIALTANVMPHDIEHYKEIGMSDHLGKPFTSQELWKCLVNNIPA